MPAAIESRTFRRAARRNCIEYLGLRIYSTSIPALRSHAFPTFRTQNPNGAVSQLFATLVNMGTHITQIRKGLRMSDAHPVPGVTWDDASGMSLQLSGPMYFENRSQYREFEANLNTLGKTYGWMENASEKMGSAVYYPAKNDLTNIDPAQAAIKGMVLSAASDAADAYTVFSASKSITKGSDAEKEYFLARDRLNGGSTFSAMALQYYSNAPTSVQNQWQKAEVPCLLIEDEVVYKANIGYCPTSLSVVHGPFVRDETGFYPTSVDISVSLSNPLGGILANFSNATDATAADATGGIVAPTYLKDVPGVYY